VKLKTIWLASLLLFYFVGLATGMFLARKVITNTATIKTVGVGISPNPDFTVSLTQIDWGVLEPGMSKNYTAYMKNTGNVPLTLNMTIEGWNPAEAAQYITLVWDAEGKTLNVSEVIQVTFTLTVSANISGITSFSFQIVIVGSG